MLCFVVKLSAGVGAAAMATLGWSSLWFGMIGNISDVSDVDVKGGNGFVSVAVDIVKKTSNRYPGTDCREWFFVTPPF